MNTAHLSVDPSDRAEASPVPLASWYTQGASDGLGDRLLMFDNTAAASLELLRFRPELATAPGFERALRESVQRLAAFRHAAFSQARSVQCLDSDRGLALISTHTPGKRLSELFHRSEGHAGMHPAFATWLIRQLAPALAEFHAYAPGVAHGALTADRIVLTPDRRLVIVEHVLGSALDERRLSADTLWQALGVIVPTGEGVLRLDSQSDIVQLGLVALSVLLGRRVTPEDYPKNLGPLLDEFAETAGRRSPALVAPLRQWLQRALTIDSGFGSALDGFDGLPEITQPVGRTASEAPHVDEPSQLSPMPTPAIALTPVAVPTPATAATPATVPTAAIVLTPATVPTLATVPTPATEPTPATVSETDSVMRFTRSLESDRSLSADTPAWNDSPAGRRFSMLRNVAVGCAVLALVEAVVIGRLVTKSSAPASVSNVPVTIESPAAGDAVMVDGRQVGVTPFQVSVGSAVHSIRVVGKGNTTPASVAPAPPAAAAAPSNEIRTGNALAVAAQRQRSGGLRLSSPIELQVLEGERVLGSSADGLIVASAGVHQLDFINTVLGYRSRQTVNIRPGEIVPLRVEPPDGRVSINAQPWAQVWIDGNLVGETPLANLAVRAGEHEVTFRHPQLGELRQTAMVKSGELTRISANLNK